MESNALYHADFSHAGSSMLKEFRRSPARYEALYVTRKIEPDPPTLDMVTGSITHLLVSGQPLETEFVVAECSTRRGKAWEEAESAAKSQGLTAILPEQHKLACAMADAVLTNKTAGPLWEADGPVEQSIRWRFKNIGLKCKPDKLIIDVRYDWTISVDLKTSANPTPDEFARAAWSYEYHAQAAQYLAGLKTINDLDGEVPQSVFVVVGKEYPHDVFVYVAGERFLSFGHDLFLDTANRLAEATESGVWLSPAQSEVQTLEPPAWVR